MLLYATRYLHSSSVPPVPRHTPTSPMPGYLQHPQKLLQRNRLPDGIIQPFMIRHPHFSLFMPTSPITVAIQLRQRFRFNDPPKEVPHDNDIGLIFWHSLVLLVVVHRKRRLDLRSNSSLETSLTSTVVPQRNGSSQFLVEDLPDGIAGWGLGMEESDGCFESRERVEITASIVLIGEIW